MTEQIKSHPKSFQVGKWFGPSLGTVLLEEEQLSAFKKMTDALLSDENTESHGAHLAGKIKKEMRIYRSDMIEYGVNDFLEGCVRTYVTEAVKQHEHLKEGSVVTSSVNSAWVVSQYENEYNPIHNHTGCEVSGVLYLKMPNVKGRRVGPNGILGEKKKDKPDSDGNIVFVYNAPSQRNGNPLENGLLELQPHDGVMFLFPSYLLHVVYPFMGKEERRCIAFNAVYRVNDKNNVYVGGSTEGMVNKTFYDMEKHIGSTHYE